MATPAFVQEVETVQRRSSRPAAATLAAPVAIGTVGAVGMVLTGSRIGSVPGDGYLWWFSVPGGASGVGWLTSTAI